MHSISQQAKYPRMNQIYQVDPQDPTSSDLYNYDHALSPEQISSTFLHQLYQTGWMKPTTVTEAFASAANVRFIKTQIEQQLQQQTQEPQPFELVLNAEFAQVMIEAVKNGAMYVNDPAHGLGVLNAYVIKHEVDTLYLSLRAQKRYVRQALYNDRIKVMPHGLNEKVLYHRGENGINPSGYLLNHPWKGQYMNYLTQVLRIKDPQLLQQVCNQAHGMQLMSNPINHMSQIPPPPPEEDLYNNLHIPPTQRPFGNDMPLVKPQEPFTNVPETFGTF